MASDITSGRIEQCKDSVGGLDAVYFVNFGDATGYTITDDVITAVAGTPSAYKYELKGTSAFEQSITSSRENGTTFTSQKLTLDLKKLSAIDNKQVKLLAYGRPQIIVQDNNGNLFLAGLTKGCDLLTATISTGGAMADKSGYSLEFEGMEAVSANFMTGDLATIGFTVVEGV